MSKVIIHPFLLEDVGGNQEIDVAGKDVGECLSALVKQYPRIEHKLFDKNGKLRGFVEIYVNGKSSFPKELAHPIIDGDEIRIIVFGAGG